MRSIVQRLESLIEQHFRDQHDPKFYAAKLAISYRQLSRICLQQTAKTPYELLQERVHREAESLLVCTDLSIKQICYELGVCDPAHFSRCFRKITGTHPSSYRKKHMQQPRSNTSLQCHIR